MGVLVMVIVASTQLLVTIIRNNNENVDTLAAYGLAEEGLEVARNIRDSNWLVGADFQGKIDQQLLWGATLPGPNETKYYVLDANTFEDAACSAGVTLGSLSSCAPWILKEVNLGNGADPENGPDPLLTQLYLQDDQGVVRYTLNHQADARISLFHRYLKVAALAVDNKDSTKVTKYRVSSFVSWKENLRAKKVVLTAELTDWKGGPL